jgi:hypothetical protein
MIVPTPTGGGIGSPPLHMGHRGKASHETLRALASVVFMVPTVLFLGIVFFVEEWPVQLWVTLGAAIAVGILLLARRRPIAGGGLIVLFGLAAEVPWFLNQLGGDLDALVSTLADVSPAWVAFPAFIAGAMFALIGLAERHTGGSAR